MSWLPRVCSHELLKPSTPRWEKLIGVSLISISCSVRELWKFEGVSNELSRSIEVHYSIVLYRYSHVHTAYILCSKVHRRCLVDDNRGVHEALDEEGQYGEGLITRGKHHLLFDTIRNSTYWHRLLAEKMMLEPILFFTPSNSTIQQEVKNFHISVCFLL